jgi:hypothetical protein
LLIEIPRSLLRIWTDSMPRWSLSTKLNSQSQLTSFSVRFLGSRVTSQIITYNVASVILYALDLDIVRSHFCIFVFLYFCCARLSNKHYPRGNIVVFWRLLKSIYTKIQLVKPKSSRSGCHRCGLDFSWCWMLNFECWIVDKW